MKRAYTSYTVVLLLAVLLAGCATTRQARRVHVSGALLSDPSVLREGTGDQPRLFYVNPAAGWSSYRRILVDPVTLWRSPDSGIRVSETDAQHMANVFHGVLVQTLSKDYELAEHPKRGTLRLTAVITDLRAERVVLNTISTVVPQMRVVSRLEELVVGRPLFTGDVGMAFKVVDGASGELLMAGVTERFGTRHLSEFWNAWANVDDAFQFWADEFRYAFCERRGGSDCVEPDAKKEL